MDGFLRSVLFGAAVSFAMIALAPVVFWLSPETAPSAMGSVWMAGICAAIASAVALSIALRSPPNPSWVVAIIGSVVGFNAAIFAMEALYVAVLAGR